MNKILFIRRKISAFATFCPAFDLIIDPILLLGAAVCFVINGIFQPSVNCMFLGFAIFLLHL